MKRSEEDQEIIERGSLWNSFKNTPYHQDMTAFLKAQESNMKDQCVEFTMSGEYERAKAVAHGLAGLLLFKQYIEDAINGANQAIENEKANDEYRKKIPSHV